MDHTAEEKGPAGFKKIYFPWYFRMQEYSRSDFAKERKVCKSERLEEEKEKKKADSKSIEIRELYAVSAKVVPFFKLYGKKWVLFA